MKTDSNKDDINKEFNFTARYLDGLFNIDNSYFAELIKDTSRQ